VKFVSALNVSAAKAATPDRKAFPRVAEKRGALIDPTL